MHKHVGKHFYKFKGLIEKKQNFFKKQIWYSMSNRWLDRVKVLTVSFNI